jgi:hypothetical protein
MIQSSLKYCHILETLTRRAEEPARRSPVKRKSQDTASKTAINNLQDTHHNVLDEIKDLMGD